MAKRSEHQDDSRANKTRERRKTQRCVCVCVCAGAPKSPEELCADLRIRCCFRTRPRRLRIRRQERRRRERRRERTCSWRGSTCLERRSTRREEQAHNRGSSEREGDKQARSNENQSAPRFASITRACAHTFKGRHAHRPSSHPPAPHCAGPPRRSSLVARAGLVAALALVVLWSCVLLTLAEINTCGHDEERTMENGRSAKAKIANIAILRCTRPQ